MLRLDGGAYTGVHYQILYSYSYAWTFAIKIAKWSSQTLLVDYHSLEAPQWHPTPVLLPGKSHGRRSLVGCSPWGCWESDMTERLHFHFSLSCIGEGNGNPLQCSCLENPRHRGAWRFPSYTYLIQYMIPFGGFPHSEISGSQLICSSPKLIAAYHVLHRLLMPRHSPCALFSLTNKAFCFTS